MKKAKTRKNIFSILSATLGAVFALIVGVTYCVSSMTFSYSMQSKSTTAYLGNQQYHVVNDTTENPILFGTGNKNFEIALQYAIDYDFDVRLKYEMKWSDNTTATNVVLNFANRDNIIYDNQYIYLANHVAAGNGKVTFITGVEFVDPNDSNYDGKTLKINILETKIYKKLDSYSDTHYLVADNSSAVSAKTWLYYKNRKTSNDSYVIMYNNRNVKASGVSYPGVETAYKKITNASNVVTGSAWAGGNRAQAGVGMYVVSGKDPIKLEVKVTAIWRNQSGQDVNSSNLISENSIKLNYTNNWIRTSWDDAKLWETRKLDLIIPEETGCYIEILDSIEIISASKVSSPDYDAYRAVINSITINPGMVDSSVTPAINKATTFTYSEGGTNSIELKQIYSNNNLTNITKTYSQGNIDVVNTSRYLPGLYTARSGSAIDQVINTAISLINNTNQTKTVSVTYKILYSINNGQTGFTNEVTNDDSTKSYLRAEDYIGTHKGTDAEGNPILYTYLDAFASGLYYGQEVEPTQSVLTSTLTNLVKIAPYSSVGIVDSYTVSSNLQSEVSNLFKSSDASVTNLFDVWTFLDVETEEVETATNQNLAIETTLSGRNLTLSVKNNTNETITGVTIKNVVAQELGTATYSKLTKQPNDWIASFWKYYTEEDGVYSQLTADPVDEDNPFSAGTYYEKSQPYEDLTLSKVSPFDVSGTTYSSNTVVLQPGESIEFATATVSKANPTLLLRANANAISTSTPSELMLINNGKDSAYIINNTFNAAMPVSYYLMFVGDYKDNDSDFIEVVTEDDESKSNYYIGIIRPGQILNIPLDGNATLKSIAVGTTYSADVLTTAGWDSTVVQKLTSLFTEK